MAANIDEQIAKTEERLKRLKKQRAMRDLKRELKQSKEQVAWTRGAIENALKALDNQAFNVRENDSVVKVVKIDAVQAAFQSILHGKQQS